MRKKQIAKMKINNKIINVINIKTRKYMPDENELNDTVITVKILSESDDPETIEEEIETSDDVNLSGGEDILLQWATKVLEQESSEEMQEIKLQILRRIATESDIKPSRIPAPMNITEVGGYFNLMMKLKKEEEAAQQKAYSDMLKQTLISILGLPMQTPME